jgi:hypothetical protein
MQPHATFLDRFTTMFNRGDEEVKIENRKKIIGTNNLLYSLGGSEYSRDSLYNVIIAENPGVDHAEADAVHVYSYKKGYYEPELDFLIVIKRMNMRVI